MIQTIDRQQTIIEKLPNLTTQQQQQVLDFIEFLQFQAKKTRNTEEVEVNVVAQPVKSESENYDLLSQKEPPKTIQQISEEFRQLRQSISYDSLSIREMIEEGRRFWKILS